MSLKLMILRKNYDILHVKDGKSKVWTSLFLEETIDLLSHTSMLGRSLKQISLRHF